MEKNREAGHPLGAPLPWISFHQFLSPEWPSHLVGNSVLHGELANALTSCAASSDSPMGCTLSLLSPHPDSTYKTPIFTPAAEPQGGVHRGRRRVSLTK